MLRSAASPGSRGVRPVGRRYEWPPHDTATDRPPDFLRSRVRGPLRRLFPRAEYGVAGTLGHPRLWRAVSSPPTPGSNLFDLAFAELDVLLGDRIVFLLDQLIGHGARVLPRHIVEPGIRARDQLYLDGGGLGHGKP